MLAKKDVCYILPALIVSGFIGPISENSPFSAETGTQLIYSIEGAVVTPFQQATHPLLTDFFIFIYIGGYGIVLLAPYLQLKAEGKNPEWYALSYALTVVLSLPFFFLLPVGVTGYYLSGVEPLLYETHGLVSAFLTSVDTLQKAFPSLHAGLTALASLHARRSDHTWFKTMIWTGTALVILSTFYLGVHWMLDAVMGAALAYICYHVTPPLRLRYRPLAASMRRTYYRYLGRRGS